MQEVTNSIRGLVEWIDEATYQLQAGKTAGPPETKVLVKHLCEQVAELNKQLVDRRAAYEHESVELWNRRQAMIQERLDEEARQAAKDTDYGT